jgi:hypothetical protein
MNDLDKIKNKIQNIWNYTELEMEDFSSQGLKKHLASISDIVNDVLKDLEEVSTCSTCNYEMCNECADDLFEDLEGCKIAP